MSHNNKAAALKHKIQPRGNRIQSGLNKKCIMYVCDIYREHKQVKNGRQWIKAP